MMPGMWVRILVFFACLGLAPTAWAASSADLPHTRVELFAESATPAPGKPLRIAIRMTPKPGWHTYWEHPGDSGMPTRAQWALPAGAEAGPLRYPTPDTFLVEGIMNHVYKGPAVLLADISVPDSASGAFPVALKLDWLVCDDRSCVPESASLDLRLKTGNGTPDPANRALFADAQAAMPVPLPERGTFALSGERIRISIPFAGTAGVERAHFFPLGDDMTLFAAPQRVERTDTALIIDTQPVPGTAPAELRGVLRVESGDTVRGFTVDVVPGPVAAGTPIAPAPRRLGGDGFLSAFGLAVLGGLLLNLMPCVFPILSLKAMSLARAGESERQARTEGIAYAAGVILVCMALGGIAIALARAGQGAGWAFQLQDPRVILLLMFLTLAIGLNFAGLFEMNAGAMSAGQSLASAPGAKGAFWTGALAAFVATPCTGPFMAGALGAALVLPPLAGLAVFAGLGLGLALPFLAIGFFPALRRRLPKPGAWMQTFRRILAIPMLLTTVALAWVLGQQAGVSGLSLGLLFALLLGLALWWLGLRQEHAGRRYAPLALLALLVLVAPLLLARLPADTAAKATEGAALSAIPFTPEKLAELQQQRKPTFLYFTADWCLTCKVNEKGALSSARVADDFRRAGITVMVGDWTKPDPAIAQFLADHGRAGIPLYLYYAPNGDVAELPQLLTVDRLLALAA